LPAVFDLYQVLSSDFIQREAEFCRDGRKVPEQIAEFFLYLFGKAKMDGSIAQHLLVLRQQRANFAREAQERNKLGL
jgi:hypothetical protein